MEGQRGLAYLDTNILLTMLGYDDVDVDYQRIINRTLYNYTIRISQVVLGEALAVILSEPIGQEKISQYQEKIECMCSKMQFDSNRFPPVNNAVIKTAHELYQISGVVSNMDALILAHAIEDKESKHFFTTDRKLKNDKIIDYIKKLQSQGIRGNLNFPADFTID